MIESTISTGSRLVISFFKRNKKEVTPATAPEILGFRLGGSFELNDLKLRMLEPYTTFKNVHKLQIIQAVGTVELDETTIVRYYTDDDGFIQVLAQGLLNDENVMDLKLFCFHDTVGVSNEADWNKLLDKELRKPSALVDNKRFERVWGDVGGDSPPVAMTETTVIEDGTESQTDQFVMLYERQMTDQELEYLLLSAEEKLTRQNTFDRCCVTSIGIDLSTVDLQIIS